jgi:hypothetical protein
MLVITEILGRAEQGMTRPFICRGDNDRTFYVKGAHAGLRSLCCEWVASSLAVHLLTDGRLSIPWFGIADVPTALIHGSARRDIRELGAGRVFASLRVDGGQELTWSTAQEFPEMSRALLLLLDLWLQNEDRSLSALGGNPNLLIQPRGDGYGNATFNRLLVYDFNLAFDQQFSRERFFGAHVFRSGLDRWPQGFRELLLPRLSAAAKTLDHIFDQLPLEWLHLDADDTLPAQLDREQVRSNLELPSEDSFWILP